MAQALRRGQARGFVAEDVDPEKAATFLLASLEGTIGLAKNAQDLESRASLFLVEASRRFAGGWMTELEVRAFSGQPPSDPLASLRTDDYVQLSLQRHF